MPLSIATAQGFGTHVREHSADFRQDAPHIASPR